MHELGNGRMSLADADVLKSLFEYLKKIDLEYKIGGSALQGTMIMTSDIDIKVFLSRRMLQANGMLNLSRALQKKNFNCEFVRKGYDFIIIKTEHGRQIELNNPQQFDNNPSYDLHVRSLLEGITVREKRLILIIKFIGRAVRIKESTRLTGINSITIIYLMIGFIHSHHHCEDEPYFVSLLTYVIKMLGLIGRNYCKLRLDRKGHFLSMPTGESLPVEEMVRVGRKRGFDRGFSLTVDAIDDSRCKTWNLAENSTNISVNTLIKVIKESFEATLLMLE